MLKIPKSVEYSILALKYIYENSGRCCVSTKEIAAEQGIPYDLLAKILQRLVKQNFIISQQGNKGGYSLNNSPDAINLNQIITAVEQKIQFTNCMVDNPTLEDCGRVENCCIKDPMYKIHNKINDIFESTTLMELIK